MHNTTDKELFDDWPKRYNDWFATPIGRLVKRVESSVLLDLLNPSADDTILDVGCGTGVFSRDVLAAGVDLVGMDISLPMLQWFCGSEKPPRFNGVTGNMLHLPFKNNSFSKTFSMTALEFVEDARAALLELERVTSPGGTIVVTTLNSLSPWAEKRLKKAADGHELFKAMTFRSPGEMMELVPEPCVVKTVIHFDKNEDPVLAETIEKQGQEENRETGAFLAVAWNKRL